MGEITLYDKVVPYRSNEMGIFEADKKRNISFREFKASSFQDKSEKVPKDQFIPWLENLLQDAGTQIYFNQTRSGVILDRNRDDFWIENQKVGTLYSFGRTIYITLTGEGWSDDRIDI